MPEWIRTALVGVGSALLMLLIKMLIDHFSGQGKEFRALDNRVVILETRLSIWLKVLEQAAIEVLHRPHVDLQDRDVLLDKYREGDLSPDEAKELFDHFLGILHGHESHPRPGETSGAMIMMASLAEKFEELRVRL